MHYDHFRGHAIYVMKEVKGHISSITHAIVPKGPSSKTHRTLVPWLNGRAVRYYCYSWRMAHHRHSAGRE